MRCDKGIAWHGQIPGVRVEPLSRNSQRGREEEEKEEDVLIGLGQNDKFFMVKLECLSFLAVCD